LSVEWKGKPSDTNDRKRGRGEGATNLKVFHKQAGGELAKTASSIFSSPKLEVVRHLTLEPLVCK
jgi:hypothetical protein